MFINPNFKKLLGILLILSLLLPVHNAVAGNDETIATPDKVVVFKIGDYNYYIVDLKQNKSETVKMDVAPKVYPPGRTFVPVRYLGNALGVDDNSISWEKNSQSATLKSNKTLKLQIGSKTMYSDSNAVQMDVAPVIVNPGRTMLPARYVAEGLGFNVEWDADNQMVIAYPEGQPKPDIEKIRKLIGDISPGVKIVSEKDLTPEVVQKIKNIGIDNSFKWSVPDTRYYAEYADAIKRDFLKVMITPPGMEPITKIDSIVVSNQLYYTDDTGRIKFYRVIVNGNQIWDVDVLFNGKERKASVASYVGTI